ncbi:MAG: UbiA family prenyltransferase, partial [Pseudomonadota bacterium]
GIMTLNDFKALEGDKQMGVYSLPVTLGPERAARMACWVMALPQAAVICLLLWWNMQLHAAAVLILLYIQFWAMGRMMTNPRALAPWYNGAGVGPYVLGMMITAVALRGLGAV